MFSKRELLARTLDVIGFGHLLRKAPSWNGVLIFNYHRIGEPGDSPFDHNLWSASAEDFDQQLCFLKKNFDVIGLRDLDRLVDQPRGRFVMVTFDDGYRDNYSVAFPILKSRGVSATFFISTGFVDRPQVPWWDELAWMMRTTSVELLPANEWLPTVIVLGQQDRVKAFGRFLAVYKSLDVRLTDPYLNFLADALGTGRCPASLANDLWMTWDMLREMKASGMTFGGHTVTHPILANQTADQQDWEVGECQRRLVEELGGTIDAFSYPNGKPESFDEFTRAALRAYGFRWSFAHDGGYCQPERCDRLALRRSPVETDVGLSQFRATATLPQVFS